MSQCLPSPLLVILVSVRKPLCTLCGSDLMLSALCEPWSACKVKTYLRAEETGTQKPVLPWGYIAVVRTWVLAQFYFFSEVQWFGCSLTLENGRGTSLMNALTCHSPFSCCLIYLWTTRASEWARRHGQKSMGSVQMCRVCIHFKPSFASRLLLVSFCCCDKLLQV